MTYLPTALPDRINVSGVEIEMCTIGDGNPLLYLHSGDGANSAAEYIQELARSYKVILPSHPGFGTSELPSNFYSIDDLAFHYLDFIEQLNLNNLVVVGSSFGGWLAVELATMCSDRISSLILSAPLGIKVSGRETRDIVDIFSIHWPDLPQYFFHQDPVAHDFGTIPDDTLERLVRNRESLTLFGWSPTLFNPKLKYRLHRVKVPTLVMWGAKDRIASVEYGKEYAQKIPDATFTVLDDAGHYLAYDKPLEFVDLINNFLNAGN